MSKRMKAAPEQPPIATLEVYASESEWFVNIKMGKLADRLGPYTSVKRALKQARIYVECDLVSRGVLATYNKVTV